MCNRGHSRDVGQGPLLSHEGSKLSLIGLLLPTEVSGQKLLPSSSSERARTAGLQRATVEQGYEQVKRFRWGVVLGVGGDRVDSKTNSSTRVTASTPDIFSS